MNIINFIIILFLADILVMFLSLKVALYFRTNYLLDYLPIFGNFYIEKYYWIVFIISLIFLFEKIYFVRYDFWSDTKKIYKGLILSFITVITVITLTKMSNDYSRAFLSLFFL